MGADSSPDAATAEATAAVFRELTEWCLKDMAAGSYEVPIEAAPT